MSSPSICPEDTRCEVDAVGQGYCAPIQGDMSDAETPRPDLSITPATDAGSVTISDTGESSFDAQPSDSTVPEIADAAMACPELNLLLKPAAGTEARVMLVVDRSYSMIMNQARWTPLREGIETVMTNLADSVQFGLTLFPNPNPTPAELDPILGESCASGVVEVETGFGTREEIANRLIQDGPVRNMGTPTASAIAAAGRFLLDNEPSENDYLLLATDGGPGCNAYAEDIGHYLDCVCLSDTCFENRNCLDAQRTETLIGGLAQSGIKTMVLGITIGIAGGGQTCTNSRSCGAAQACVNNQCQDALRPTLNRLAAAGGASEDGTYFEVSNLDQLQAGIQMVAGSVRSCSFDLEALGEFGNRLLIYIDGELVPNDPSRQDGWYAEDNVLTLYGSACAGIRDGRAHSISAQCATE